MAQALGPYGVHGWFRLRPFSEAPDALLDYRSWWLRARGSTTWSEVTPVSARMHSGTLVAQLAGVDSREEAQALAGAEIGVPRAAMPVPAVETMYCSDLVGLAVVNRGGVLLGEVTAVEDYGAHPVLKVAAGVSGEARLIPFVAAYVDEVDPVARRIVVDWQPDY